MPRSLSSVEHENLLQLTPLCEPIVRDLTARSGHPLVCNVCAGLLASPGGICVGCTERANSAAALGVPLADRVVPLAYARRGKQIHTWIHQYKNPFDSPSARENALTRLRWLLWSFLGGHLSCLLETSSLIPDAVTTVPSGNTDRKGSHPLESFLYLFPEHWQRVSLVRSRTIGRTYHPESLAFAMNSSAAQVQHRHVIVLDDTWATGSKAQGVASFLRGAGAAEVTVLCLARFVNTGFSMYPSFEQAYGNRLWLPDWCPLHGYVCGHGYHL